MEELKGNIRVKENGNSAKRTRRKGLVPGIMYGRGYNNVLFEISDLDLNYFFSNNGEHGSLDLNIEGNKYKTLIKDVQRDSVSKKVIHMDVEAYGKNQMLTMEVPIHFSGENDLRSQGGIIQKEKTNIKVECNSDKIPQYIDVNISKLKQGTALRISDIEISGEISILEDLNSVVLSFTKANTSIIDNVAEHKEDQDTLADNNKKISESSIC